MPTSDARIRANILNAAKSTGPKTPEGKEHSRANSLKHGLTGAGVVLPVTLAAEVDRRAAAFATEVAPSGELGMTLVRHAAVLSVRMDTSFERETAAIAEHVRKAQAEFEAPPGVNEAEATRLRTEAGKRAMFDPSSEACLARKYENAAERGFYRALKELRLLEKKAKAQEPALDAESLAKSLGSFLQADHKFDDWVAKMEMSTVMTFPSKSSDRFDADFLPPFGISADVPFTIGRAR